MQPLRVFLSYNFRDESFVARLFVLPFEQTNRNCAVFLCSCTTSRRLGQLSYRKPKRLRLFRLYGWRNRRRNTSAGSRLVFQTCRQRASTGVAGLPSWRIGSAFSQERQRVYPVTLERGGIPGVVLDDDENLARQIFERTTGTRWTPVDGVPLGYPFAGEKDIIEVYRKARENPETSLDPNLLQQGCPAQWPGLQIRSLQARRLLSCTRTFEHRKKIGSFGPKHRKS